MAWLTPVRPASPRAASAWIAPLCIVSATLLVACGGLPANGGPPRLELREDPESGWVVEVAGLADEQLEAMRDASPEALAEAFQVFTVVPLPSSSLAIQAGAGASASGDPDGAAASRASGESEATAGAGVAASGAPDSPPVPATAAAHPRSIADAAGERPAVLGEVTLEGRRLRWTPTFPLAPGQAYRARWRPAAAPDGAASGPGVTGSGVRGRGSDPGGVGSGAREAGAGVVELRFALPGPDPGDPPRVVAIHPDVETVPANLLRAYVHFSAPMRAGRAAELVSVLADGEPLDGAFVPAEAELWNPEQDRLTLLFDPGRIKLEVGPNLEVGAPLREGMEVELRVEPGWPDRSGVPTAEAFTRRWTVGPDDRTRPRAEAWDLVPPDASQEPLVVGFDEPLDRALAGRLLHVETAAGDPVPGEATVAPGGDGWSFRPRDPWEEGDYVLRVGPELEDLAGNSLERLFDEPLDPDRVGEADMGDVRLPFGVGGTGSR